MSEKEVKVNNKPVRLQRGQLAVSIARLAYEWKTSPSKVKRELKMMEDDGLIHLEAVGRTCSIVTLTCYLHEDEEEDEAAVQTESKQNDKRNSKQDNEAQTPSALGTAPLEQLTEQLTKQLTKQQSIKNNKNRENNIYYIKKKKDNKEKDKTGLLFFPDPNRNYEEGLWD